MKKFLLTAAALALSFGTPASASTPQKVCVGLGEYASSVMRARQSGMPESEVLSIINTKSASTYRLLVATVSLVYKLPVSLHDSTVGEIVASKCLEDYYS